MIYDAYCKSNDRPRAQSFLRILTSPSPSSCKFFDLKSFERIVETTRFEGIGEKSPESLTYVFSLSQRRFRVTKDKRSQRNWRILPFAFILHRRLNDFSIDRRFNIYRESIVH